MPQENDREVSSATIIAELKGIHFPTDKTQMMHHARRADTGRDPEDVVALLEQLPDRQYESLADIQGALAERP